MSPEQEILGPAITSREDAQLVIGEAIRHFTEARRATIQVMADLRRLEDGQVHLLYGYRNFAKWAEDTFPGMGGVRQLTRAGAVALELDRRKLIDLENPKGVGTTALRELSVIANTYGDDKMAEVFTTAREMISGKDEVSGTNVQAAMRVLMPPAKPVELDEDGPSEADLAINEYEHEPQTEQATKEQELIEHIRDLSYDLPESLGELADAVVQLTYHKRVEGVAKDQEWIEGTR